MLRPVLHACVKLSALLLSALCACVPARAQSTAQCPRVEIVCPPIIVAPASDLVFSVRLDPPGDPARLAYSWDVSAGLVVNGQGTPSITLDAAGIDRIGTTVTVDVRGLAEGCPASASCTVLGQPGCGRPLDEYGNIRFNDAKARLDNLAIELQNDPTAGGHIICYGGRIGRAGEARRHCDRAKDYIVTHRGIEASRIVAEDGGHRENLTVTFWVVPQGATPPSPSPTVDPGEVTIIESKPKRRVK